MLLKRNRDSLRGLSHEQKVKKLQKITKVPLENLKTNIAESDLEQDDVSVPISLKVHQQHPQSYEYSELKKRQSNSKKKVFDQERINRTIRTMTKELDDLEMIKQKQNDFLREFQKTIQPFEVEHFSFELNYKNFSNPKTNHNVHNFYSSKNFQINQFNRSDENDQDAGRHSGNCTTELSEISNKIDNQSNIVKNSCNLTKQKQFQSYRQTQPIMFPENKNNQKSNKMSINSGRQLQNNITGKRQSFQCNISKRFSRTRRNQNFKNNDSDNNLYKKNKFNRSNQKNKPLIYIPHQQFDSNKRILTQRLSYQHIPCNTSSQENTILKKKKNFPQNFDQVRPHQNYRSEMQNLNNFPKQNEDSLIKLFGDQKSIKQFRQQSNKQEIRLRIQTLLVQYDVIKERDQLGHFLHQKQKCYKTEVGRRVSEGVGRYGNEEVNELMWMVLQNYEECVSLLRQIAENKIV